MKINLAKSAGFCFGVKRAINIALKAASRGRQVYMLGDIVHNEDVIKQLREAGIKKIKRLTPANNKLLLIRAHGAAKATILKARKLGYKIIDATCPMVKEIHRIALNWERRGFRIIVIGDKRHEEVQGIIADLKNTAMVIDNLDRIPFKKINPSTSLRIDGERPFDSFHSLRVVPSEVEGRSRTIKTVKKACIVVQSTQNLDKVLKMVDILYKFIPEVRFFNTICVPTRTKQEEIKRLPLENDVMIIIGSKNSANTKRLYEISKSQNKNSFWINSKDEIKKNWFKGTPSVGITAGASTPEETIRDIVQYLRAL